MTTRIFPDDRTISSVIVNNRRVAGDRATRYANIARAGLSRSGNTRTGRRPTPRAGGDRRRSCGAHASSHNRSSGTSHAAPKFWSNRHIREFVRLAAFESSSAGNRQPNSLVALRRPDSPTTSGTMTTRGARRHRAGRSCNPGGVAGHQAGDVVRAAPTYALGDPTRPSRDRAGSRSAR